MWILIALYSSANTLPLQLCEHSPWLWVLLLLPQLGPHMSLVVVLLQLPHIHNAARHCRVCSSNYCSLGNAPYTYRRYKGSPSQGQAGKGLGGQEAQCLFQWNSCKSAQIPQTKLALTSCKQTTLTKLCAAGLSCSFLSTEVSSMLKAAECLHDIDCVDQKKAFHTTGVFV